jgi:ADP-ribosylation factor family
MNVMFINLLAEEITIHLHQQESWFWIPILLGGLGGLGGLIYALSEETKTKKLEGKSMGILGMSASGKTLLLRSLQGKPYEEYEQTSNEEYDSFTLTIGTRSIKIAAGKDIGGVAENVKPYYESFLNDKDICVFLFDLQRYLNDNDYMEETNARFDHIYRHLIKEKEYAIIGSHVDKVKIKKGESIINIVQSKVADKPYANLLKENFYTRNLTDKNDIETLVEKLF